MDKSQKPKVEFRYYSTLPQLPIYFLTGDGWLNCRGTRTVCLHFHNLMEIGYCYSGNGNMLLGEHACKTEANMISIIPPNYPHSTDSIPDSVITWEYLFIDVDSCLQSVYGNDEHKFNYMKQLITQKARYIHAKEYPDIASAFRIILHEMLVQKEYSNAMVKGMVFWLLMRIARMTTSEEDHEILSYKRPLNLENVSQIRPALEMIRKQYTSSIKIQDLADICSISETYFRKLFKKMMGVSALDYINKVRIMNAAELMQKTDDPLHEIISKTGFISESTFNRNFKKYTGMSPRQWKEKYAGKECRLKDFDIYLENGW